MWSVGFETSSEKEKQLVRWQLYELKILSGLLSFWILYVQYAGLQALFSLYEIEGTMSEIHANHVLMVNSITELKAHGHPRPSKPK